MPTAPAATLPPPAAAAAPKAFHPKPALKRRRAPQKPGRTAADKTRLFVQHNYHDLSLVPDLAGSAEAKPAGGAKPGSEPFPVKL